MTFCTSVLTIALYLLFAMPSACPAEKRASDDGVVLISYSAPQHRIVLTPDFRITDIEELAEYANPVSATPSKVVTVEKKTYVTSEEVAELLRLIKKSGFYDLKDAYGTRLDERSYPYIIAVRTHEAQEKQVVWRSGPNAESKPKAFAAAEASIIEFARKSFEINPGEEQ